MKYLAFYRFIKIVNVVLVCCTLGVIVAYYKMGTLGIFSILQLFAPWLLLLHLSFMIFWGFLKRWKWCLLCLGILLLSFGIFGSFYRIKTRSQSKGDFSVMSYNAMGFNRYQWIKVPNAGDKISNFIREENPDILCLQEHSRIRYKQLTQYPHKIETAYSVPRSIQAIFSKFPIISQGELNPPNTTNNIIYADIVVDRDTIRVYNVHLQSFQIVPSDANLTSTQSGKLYRPMITTFAKQMEQARILKAHILKSPYKVLVCGDFNNTQFSNVYKNISDNMNDSFFESGKGFGTTYLLKGLPMRIDYILAENSFKIVGHRNFKIKYSDHYPVMAELELKE